MVNEDGDVAGKHIDGESCGPPAGDVIDGVRVGRGRVRVGAAARGVSVAEDGNESRPWSVSGAAHPYATHQRRRLAIRRYNAGETFCSP